MGKAFIMIFRTVVRAPLITFVLEGRTPKAVSTFLISSAELASLNLNRTTWRKFLGLLVEVRLDCDCIAVGRVNKNTKDKIKNFID